MTHLIPSDLTPNLPYILQRIDSLDLTQNIPSSRVKQSGISE